MGTELVKRWDVGLLTLAMLCFVTACGSQESSDISMQETYFSEDITETEPADRADGQQTSEQNKILIAYFTWAENARPKLVEKVSDLSDYDTVFVGYPNWWYSAPMAVFSFLEENDLSGKSIVLFCSHGTGGLASSVKDISAVLPDSQIESNVLGVYREDIPQSQETIQNWLEEIGY